MRLATNHGHGDPIAHTFPAVVAVGFQIIRQEPHQDAGPQEQEDRLAEFTVEGAPGCWWLVPGPPPGDSLDRMVNMAHRAAASGIPVAIEIGNEPDLHWDGIDDISERPERYADWVDACYVAIRQVNPSVVIIAGGVSNPHKRGLDFLEGSRARDWPEDIVCGIHRYPREDWPMEFAPNGAAMVTHKGFASREEEWAALKDVIGPERRIWVGEHGFHTAPRDVLLRQERWTDIEVAVWMRDDLDFFLAHGVEVTCQYQFGDADPSIYDPDNRMHCFGVIYPNGSEKPVADVFKQGA